MDHRPLIDRLTSLRIEEEEKTKGLKITGPTEEEIQGMAFRPGDTVIDKTTGKEVTVLAGKRASYTVSTPRGGGG